MREYFFKTSNGIRFVGTADTVDRARQNLIDAGWKVTKEELKLMYSKKI